MPAVLFVNTVGDVGGSEMCLLRLMAGLREAGQPTILACPPRTRLSARAQEEGGRVWPLDVPSVLDPHASFDLVPASLGLRGPGPWRRRFGAGLRALRMPPAALRLAKRVRAEPVRLVHANNPRAALVGGLAARLAGRPAVTHVRDLALSPFSRPLRRRLLHVLSDVFIAPSRATAAVIGAPRPVHVVPDGLPERVLRDTRPHRPLNRWAPEIGMVAVMTPWKGHEVLIRAAPAILREFPRARITILGGDWGHPVFAAYRAQLERLVAELGLAEVVHLAGDVPDVASRLAAFDLVVHPPTSGDPFPGAVLEACLAGCAIVATDTGGIPEMVSHEWSALLVPTADAGALAAAVVRVLREPGLAERLGEQARADVTRFSLEAGVARILDLYAELDAPGARRLRKPPGL